MKIIIRKFLVVGLCLATCASALSREFDSKTYDRLAELCRVWGFVRYAHPKLAYEEIDWDKALVDVLPDVKSASSDKEYRAAIAAMLSKLDDPVTKIIGPEPEKQVDQPENIKPWPSVETLDDGTLVISANDYEMMEADRGLIGKIVQIGNEAIASSKVVVDLRSFHGDPTVRVVFGFNYSLPQLMPADTSAPLSLYAVRKGYVSQASPLPHEVEYVVRSRGVYRASRKHDVQRNVAFIINSRSANIAELLMAFQVSGRAVVIEEGAGSQIDGATTEIALSDGYKARIRTTQYIGTDGRLGFQPDVSVPPSEDSSRDLAMEAALKAVREGQSSSVSVKAPAPYSPSGYEEMFYNDMAYPDEDYRLLSLFKFWNVIEYFFPYKDLMDIPWDQTLLDFMPKMIECSDAVDYQLTVCDLASRIQDTHVFISSPTLSDHFGRSRPPFRVRRIEGKIIVTEIQSDKASQAGVHVGDEVLAMDGVDIEDQLAKVVRILPASTPHMFDERGCYFLLGGPEDSEAKITLRDAQGVTRDVVVQRTASVYDFVSGRNGPAFKKLTPDIGYIDLDRLRSQDVDEALATVMGTKGLILDMRGYPIGGSFELAHKLSREPNIASKLFTPIFDGSIGRVRMEPETQYMEPRSGDKYDGKIAVLINGIAQSAAEHTCLHLEAAAPVTFIGSATSGANGTITYTVLPGGIAIRFTNVKVLHGDDRQLQRVGILPDIEIHPTIEGIREGKDELLDRAIRFIEEGK